MDNEFGESSSSPFVMGTMLLLMGVGLGTALYWTFAPGEVVRRQRVNQARRYLNSTRVTAQKMVDDAQSLLVRVKRGDPVNVPARPPKCSVATAKSRRSLTDDSDDDYE